MASEDQSIKMLLRSIEPIEPVESVELRRQGVYVFREHGFGTQQCRLQAVSYCDTRLIEAVGSNP